MTWDLRNMKVGVVWRHLISISAVLVALWAFSGPFIKSQAETTLVEMLTRQGMAPQTFRDIQSRVTDIGAKVGNIDRDIETLKTQSNKQTESLGRLEEQQRYTAELLGQLLRAQLNKRAAAEGQPDAD